MVTIRVPASTANLGPGFDCLGMALTLYDHFHFERTPGGLSFDGFEPQYQNSGNLVYQAYLAGLSHLGLQPQGGLQIKADCEIPARRGLGSSAACITAGLLAAFALTGQAPDKQAVFALASRMEGHPDNAAACVFGGLRVSITEAEGCLSLPAPVHPDWRFLALVPEADLPTKTARAVLPQTVPLSDAVFNLSRTALMLEALSQGDRRALSAACQDRLHQQQRFGLISGAQELRRTLLLLGADACFLSGAGPSLLCIYQQEGFLQQAQAQIPAAFPHHALRPLSLCQDGAMVLPGSSPLAKTDNS